MVTEEFPGEAFSTERSYLDKAITYESTMDLEHLGRVMNEALRYEPPVSNATAVVLLEDMQLGKYHFKKGDHIVNHFHGLHVNENEW